jgi:hypothetical protein
MMASLTGEQTNQPNDANYNSPQNTAYNPITGAHEPTDSAGNVLDPRDGIWKHPNSMNMASVSGTSSVGQSPSAQPPSTQPSPQEAAPQQTADTHLARASTSTDFVYVPPVANSTTTTPPPSGLNAALGSARSQQSKPPEQMAKAAPENAPEPKPPSSPVANNGLQSLLVQRQAYRRKKRDPNNPDAKLEDMPTDT